MALRDLSELDKIKIIPTDVLSESGSRVGIKYKEFVKDNPGKTLLLEKQFLLVNQMAESLTRSVGHLLHHPDAEREVEIYWEHNGIPMRAKLDCVIPTEYGRLVIDCKTAASIDQWSFWREVRHRKLYIQDAHYRMAEQQRHPDESIDFVFVVVEKKPPFKVRLYRLSDADVYMAAREWSEGIEGIRRCTETGDWSDPEDGQIIELPQLSRNGD